MTYPINRINQTKLKAHKPLSYLKDLAFLQMSLSLFKTSLDDLLKDEKIFIKTKTDNKHKKTNQQIKRRIESLIDQRGSLFTDLCVNDSLKVNELAKKLFKKMVTISEKNISLNMELLAIYILWCRFKEQRLNLLHKDFEYYSNSKRLFDLAYLICEVDIEDKNIEYSIATKLKKVI